MMTTIETPPPASPEPAPHERRSGFYVAPWLMAVLGGLVLLAVGFVVGRAVDRGDHGDHHGRGFFRGGDGGSGHPGLRILVVLIVLALIVTGIVLLVRHFTTPRSDTAALDPATTATNAEQVLADRFARGEIDEAEFVSRRNALRT
jgi:putative membrane protein